MRALLGVVWILVMSADLQAQTYCVDSDTFDSCAEKLAKKAAPGSAQEEETARIRTAELTEMTASRASVLAAKNTGDVPTSTINDFLPLLRAFVDTGGFSDQDGEKLGFEWSNLLGLPAVHQNKLTAMLVSSEVYAPIKAALRASSLEDQISALEEKIDEGDDVRIGFSYSRASDRYGRDPELHARFFSALLREADTPVQKVSEARDRLREFEGRKQLTDEQVVGPFSGIPAEYRAEYIRLAEAQILAELNSMRDLGKRLRRVGFYGLLDLINNQPQLNFSAEYRARAEEVGPDELTAAVSYEMGWTNVNTYREHEKDNCRDVDKLSCLADYLSEDEVITNLQESRRISFGAEYSKLQRLNFALPGTAFTYSAEPVERFSVNAGVGRYIGKEVQGRTRARIDARLSYENFNDDPARQDRGVATATFTYPVAEGFFLSIGAVYATKPEFRGDVDAEVSARAGIIYKVIQEQ